jgi:prepilin-type N-terminal cleavage/methylation domain-containing protein
MQTSESKQNSELGFTLMEILVATAIFTVVVSAMLVLFNNTLQINRRVQSLRQVSQGTRNFTEMISREIRNGRIDYASANRNCDSANYTNPENQSLAIINKAGERICFYLQQSDESLYISKDGATDSIVEKINPPNFLVLHKRFRFIVLPQTDPNPGGTQFPGIQPMVTILATFSYQPPSGETAVEIPFQTTISTDIYDIPAFAK